jgi:hypothetical protein
LALTGPVCGVRFTCPTSSALGDERILADRIKFLLSVFQRRVKESNNLNSASGPRDYPAALFVFWTASCIGQASDSKITSSRENAFRCREFGRKFSGSRRKYRGRPAPRPRIQVFSEFLAANFAATKFRWLGFADLNHRPVPCQRKPCGLGRRGPT